MNIIILKNIYLLIRGCENLKNQNRNFIAISPVDPSKQASGIIFFKPEVCDLPHKALESILQYFFNMTKLYEIEIQSSYVISGKYLIDNNIIEKNYSSIRDNSLLCKEQGDFSHPLLSYALKINNCQIALGGLFLFHQGYSAETLMNLWYSNGKITRIDDDLYSVSCWLDGKKILLINGFFPYQMQQYNSTDSKIIFFTFGTSNPFSILKQYFQGTAESTNRYKHSMRQYLADYMEGNLIGELTPSQNGIHMSGNSNEGITEAKLFLESLNTNSHAQGNSICLPT